MVHVGVSETRPCDHFFCGVDEATVHLPVLPLLLCDAPASQRIFLESLQPGLLRALIEMHPELQDERAVIREAALEVDDLIEPRAELGPVDPPVDPVDQRSGVPGAQEEPDAALRRQVAPEPPVLRTLALFFRRLPVGTGQQPARIHPLVEQVHALALAGAVHAAKKDDDRRSPILAQPALHVEQVLAQRRYLRFVVAAGNLSPQLGCFEHAFSLVERDAWPRPGSPG